MPGATDDATMLVREYEPADADALAAVFRDSVQGAGRLAYDPARVRVWSAAADGEDFRHLLGEGLTLVGAVDGRIAGFGQLHPADHIALLYTATAFARQGCATRIYAALEAHASARGVESLRTEASRVARHFFLKMGFRVSEAEVVTRDGLSFERFRMHKRIA